MKQLEIYLLVAPALEKKIVLSVEAEMTGQPLDAAEGRWALVGGIEVLCIYGFYGFKKSKAEFRNKLSKLNNITDKRLVFIASCCCFLHLDNKRDISRT